MRIHSVVKHVGEIPLPAFGGEHLYMQPVDVAVRKLPEKFARWSDIVSAMLDRVPMSDGVVYLTIDEKELTPGKTHRRGGAHVDGVWVPEMKAHAEPGRHVIRAAGEWDARPYWSRAVDGGGLVLLSNIQGCKAWAGDFNGEPGEGGDLESIREQLDAAPSFLLAPQNAYLLNAWGIHESIPVDVPVQRSLVRLTLPETVVIH